MIPGKDNGHDANVISWAPLLIIGQILSSSATAIVSEAEQYHSLFTTVPLSTSLSVSDVAWRGLKDSSPRAPASFTPPLSATRMSVPACARETIRGLQDGTTMAGRKDAVTQLTLKKVHVFRLLLVCLEKGFQTHDEIYGNGASVLSVEDSAREVPTGPDPLHHNSNPAGP
ncbi:hypothetical protein CJ030_MR1G005706 [Morella rubra]|uniref:Uncharacterized protein n=1 Tax=Morella rubra TaxID=262757 RepID=A0A6A1WQY7_9ROSI|nr:hypothetical protein CJ030_MR1G005706 [Morella rubra]